MKYFSGTVSHQLDAKNRIRIPAKFKGDDDEEFYFVVGSQKCVSVFPKASLEERLEALKNVRTSDPKQMLAKRKIQSSVEKVETDGYGRTVLSEFFREYANIKKDVVTIGMGDYLEIWAKDEFEKYTSQMSFEDAYALIDF